MRNLLALVGAVVVGFAVVGWYMNWYQLSFSKTADGQLRVETKVDADRVVKDTSDKAKQVGALLGDQIDRVQKDAATPSPTPGTTPAPVAVPTDPAKKDDSVWFFGRNVGGK